MTPPESTDIEPPLALLAELTHRCPLRCPYCSNPLELARASAELDTGSWRRVFEEAAALGVLQVHFSGGEPLVRRDLVELVTDATKAGLYVNLITSGIRLDAGRLARLVEAGLEHVQLSLQDSEPTSGDRIAGLAGAQEAKRRVARLVCEAGLPLTINAVVHRQNLEHLDQIIDLAVTLGADRLEVAHVQYYGWGLANRGIAADPAAARRRDGNRRGGAGTPRRPAGHRLRPAGLSRAPPEGLHGWLGAALLEHHPNRQSAAMPCGGDSPGIGFSDRRRSRPRRHLAPFASIPAVPRHGVDGRALPLL